MFVEPEWRGKNINQMIIENLERWTIEKGITEIRLEVYIENLAALKAYEKAGFRKLLVEMRMGLNSNGQ